MKAEHRADPVNAGGQGFPGRLDAADARLTIGQIAQAHKVDVHTVTQALPMTPGHGPYPFNPAPVLVRPPERRPVTLSPEEADAVADELAMLLEECRSHDAGRRHTDLVALSRAMNRLRPGSGS